MGGGSGNSLLRSVFRRRNRDWRAAVRPRRGRTDRPLLYGGKGSLRGRVRARQPAGLGRDPAARHAVADRRGVGVTARLHRMPFGAELQSDGQVRFRLWAPSHATIRIEIDDAAPTAMQRLAEGWYELTTPAAQAGSRYRYVLSDGMRVPDPASRHQPEDVHGPSEVID